jgi:ferredoxin
MELTADHDLCEGNAVCVGLAPKVFALSDDDQVVILQADPPQELLERVRKAVDRCPKNALNLDEG